ncbi:hypothetical protein GCM10028818_50040 [Spirosoma horti]
MQNILKLLTCVLFISFSGVANGQSKEVQFIINTTIDIMKQHSVNAKLVNWKKAKKRALNQAKLVTSPYQLGPVIRDLYRMVDDYHGAFYYKDSTFRWRYHEPVVSDSIMNEWKKGAGLKIELLENNIGYLRIPGMQFSGKIGSDRKAQELNDSLCNLLQRNVKGLVIDLRLNGGGAMYPMILGVQQLLEKGQIGSFQSQKSERWFLTESNFSFDTTILASIKPKCAINGQTIPVAFIISPPTGSSAEFLLIAFRGRPKTVLVGTETAGFVTGIEGFPVNEATQILLSTSYGRDRRGIIYKNAFKPDISVTSYDSFNNIRQDEKVKQAVNWLKQN